MLDTEYPRKEIYFGDLLVASFMALLRFNCPRLMSGPLLFPVTRLKL